MKRVSGIAAAFAAAIIVCLAAVSANAQPQFYGSVRSGFAETQTMRFAQPTSASIAIDPLRAWVLTGTFGARLSSHYRVEGVLSYQRGGINGAFNENALPIITCGTTPGEPCLDRGVRGSLKVPTMFVMGHYDKVLAPNLVATVGVGVGAVWMTLDAHTTARSASGTPSRFDLIEGTDTVLAGRAEASLIYGRGPLNFILGYSYMRTTPVALHGHGAYTSFNFNPHLDSHQVTAGVRFRF